MEKVDHPTKIYQEKDKAKRILRMISLMLQIRKKKVQSAYSKIKMRKRILGRLVLQRA